MTEGTPPLDAVSAAEAGERYRFALARTAGQLDELHKALSLDADVMNVLCLLYLDLGTDMLRERTDPMALYHARERGWIAGDRRVILTNEGLAVWWDWKNTISPHLRDERFQQLWRDVTGW
ncbi:hypothetical protein BBK82_10660 [Lentzea guizhouensis]|uniref:Uncharacterized protein n=1 Tax=Lentzea guizhouensis TaxID=1586287 RepID=A0A1B2HFC6_9PSEU|nr:hypothetical protein [Lentzea guizhouensis]ANZ36458.1 hypothetical protein BBK82_10660 [Lentzea guizhouensis]